MGLTYQQSKLYVEGEFSIDGAEVDAAITLEAPSYDENGRMLARDAVIAFGENSIVSGMGFAVSGGEVYVTADELVIPLKNSDAVSGIFDIISLFCISEKSYYSSEKITDGSLVCEQYEYRSGENRAVVLMDTESRLPVKIKAVSDGRRLECDIKLIRTETD